MNNLQIQKIQSIIQYSFNDISLLELALTHSSYLQGHKDNKTLCNERLEFIGDGLLDAIIGCRLYKLLPEAPEGELTKIRASIVCEKSLSEIGKKLKLNEFIRVSNGEKQIGGNNKDSIIADAVEALIGATFFDGGYQEAEQFVLCHFKETIEAGMAHKINKDYKSLAQEVFQKNGNIEDLTYRLAREEGPSHDKTFYVELLNKGVVIGIGSGKKKKDAEQEAAKEALEKGGLL